MARPRNSVASYLRHKATGRARAVWTNIVGMRRERLLPGTAESNLLHLMAASSCRQGTALATLTHDGGGPKHLE